MRIVRLAALLALVTFVGVVGPSAAAVKAPRNLHGFLLRADEPRTTSFDRTPSFAWTPVAGALRYEFQLSTTNSFRDNGILYDNRTLLTPVEAPPLTLPWITGAPHGLYARVRALFANGASPWSARFGFDITPPPPPTPEPSYPGLLRWTPVEGADAYEVWFVDIGKFRIVRTNVVDERAFYLFHPTPQWIGTVRWRVRALRGDVLNHRINGLPAALSGAWSPIYTSLNPPVTNAPIGLVGTLSDVFSNGSSRGPAHALMPAFVWTGNEDGTGAPAQLFRVYVFTDRHCINPIYASSVVGGPAWAPRVAGLLKQPGNGKELTTAATSILDDGTEKKSAAFDFEDLVKLHLIKEQEPSVTPTTQVPGSVPSFPGTTPPLDSTGAPDAGSSDSGTPTIAVGGSVGPPVDLWDTNWPQSGYYWTVVAVRAYVSTDGSVQYQDLELPQDVCAAGRVQRFGISSQPSLTTARAPFATGLSATGRLVSAAKTPAFYGQPLVAWTPAFNASAYELQWSTTRYPFAPSVDPRTKSKGYLTFSTSAVLPLGPGTWWYRVRGIDFNLPTGVQQMAWSDTQKLVVTAPTFKVKKVKAKPKRFKVVGASK
jgi:hypothetical protein